MEGLKAIKAALRRGIDNGGGDDDDEPLSPGARMVSHPDVNMYAVLIFTFKTPINLAVFRNLMTPLLRHPRFSSLLQPVAGASTKFKWVRTREVDIDDHVIVPELETGHISGGEVVDGYISGLSSSVMDMSRPMWEWHVLNVKTSDDAESTAVFRLHHSIGDGASLMSLLLSLADGEGRSSPAPALKQNSQLMNNNHYNNKMGQKVFNTWVSFVLFLRTLVFNMRDTETPLGTTSSSSTAGGGVWKSRKFVRKTISLDDVKMVKYALNATVNDVMLGVVQAGVSRYLQRKKTFGGNKYYATNYSNDDESQPINYMRIRAAMTMNLRPSSGIPELSEMMKVNSRVKWGNKFAFVMVPLNIEEKEDVLDYVRESKTSMDKKKLSFEPNLSYLWTKFHPSMVPKVGGKITLGFSNVPGLSTEITLFGHQVTNIIPYVYGKYPVALSILVGSYGKKMNIVCSVDDSVISDPRQLCDDLEEAFDTIKKAVMVRSKL